MSELVEAQGGEGDAVAGPDGVRRCPWGIGPEDYRNYHDTEWGRAVHGERELYERLTLEAFQSGLSWLTILRKRENFRRAFAEFDPERVADFTAADRDRLLSDPGIVRNRAKVDAAVTNARAVLNLRDHGGLDALIWSFAPPSRHRPRRLGDVPSATPESRALAAELKRRGMTFLGPTTVYSTMQACGLVDDHLDDCFLPLFAVAAPTGDNRAQ